MNRGFCAKNKKLALTVCIVHTYIKKFFSQRSKYGQKSLEYYHKDDRVCQ
jgi:hypothetical protein